MDTIGARIKHARKQRGLTQEDVAKHFGINRVSVAQWEGRGNSPESGRIPALATLLGVSADWLHGSTDVEPAWGELPPAEGARELRYEPIDQHVEDWQGDVSGFTREHYAPKTPGAIPELDAKAGAGEGAVGEVIVLPLGGTAVSAHRVVDEWPLPQSWLREATRNPEQTIVLPIDGDSMVPNYMPGDRVLIDLSQDQLIADGVYLISYDMSPPQIKRLQRVPLTVPPRVAIKSDNQAYERFEVELDLIRIHGRVCAYVGRR